MNISNLVIMIGSDKFEDINILHENFDFVNKEGNKIETWYKTNYTENYISDIYIKSLENLKENSYNFLFRSTNKYITNEHEIITCNTLDCNLDLKPPTKVLTKNWLTIWQKVKNP